MLGLDLLDTLTRTPRTLWSVIQETPGSDPRVRAIRDNEASRQLGHPIPATLPSLTADDPALNFLVLVSRALAEFHGREIDPASHSLLDHAEELEQPDWPAAGRLMRVMSRVATLEAGGDIRETRTLLAGLVSSTRRDALSNPKFFLPIYSLLMQRVFLWDLPGLAADIRLLEDLDRSTSHARALLAYARLIRATLLMAAPVSSLTADDLSHLTDSYFMASPVIRRKLESLLHTAIELGLARDRIPAGLTPHASVQSRIFAAMRTGDVATSTTLWQGVANRQPDSLEMNVRIALVERDASRARTWLTIRQRGCGPTPLDGLHEARLHHLTGHSSWAAGALASSIDQCTRAGLERRLAYELDAASELSRGALFMMMSTTRTAAEPELPSTAKPVRTLTGTSDAIVRLRRQLPRLAEDRSPIAICGATGTGKSHLAAWLHDTLHPDRPLVVVHGSTSSRELFASDLFGHARGAFTGAQTARFGFIEAAGSGTLVLENIDDLPPDMQALLVPFLDSRTYRRIGESKVRRTSCRIIATLSRSLDQARDDMRLRDDLYWRFRSRDVALPGLAERTGDIPDLVAEFRRDLGLTEPFEVPRSWMMRDWPGNLRQLRQKVEGDAAGLPETTGGPVAAPNRNQRRELRRRDLLDWIRASGRVHRKDVIRRFAVSPLTASRDLEHLIRSGQVVKREPTASPRSHYFEAS